jgi:hypothetical protein
MLEPGGLFRLDLLHATVFLSMLAARSDLAQGLDLLHDKSPLHELVHMQASIYHSDNEELVEHVKDRLIALEKLLPGMPPDEVPTQRIVWQPSPKWLELLKDYPLHHSPAFK